MLNILIIIIFILREIAKKWIDASPEAHLKDFDVVVSVLH